MTPQQPAHPIRLDDLIDAIRRVQSEPLDQLSDAVIAAAHLGEVSDHLIGHFVDQARRAGASWTEIGTSMGVSKQAAQKRFVPKGSPSTLDPNEGFARFTERTKNVVVRSMDEARAAGNAEIGATHLVLGLLTEPESLAALAITAQSVTLDQVRAAATAALPAKAESVPDLIPYDAGARKVLEMTFREALRLGHNYVGTEHLLLALLEQEQGEGPLNTVGITKAAAEKTILEVLASLD
ncbi:Clp protease N-terminal domain-containing protein [Tomitella biformata]|uniref:Clp protease N-terminal domain-containing protein n=1 Tax=Tomitella biformata TaxID=630403 RepID=UPI0004BA04F9|nr:Clp protease N-terminal domain-containing protein [Tomitella biformata]